MDEEVDSESQGRGEQIKASDMSEESEVNTTPRCAACVLSSGERA